MPEEKEDKEKELTSDEKELQEEITDIIGEPPEEETTLEKELEQEQKAKEEEKEEPTKPEEKEEEPAEKLEKAEEEEEEEEPKEKEPVEAKPEEKEEEEEEPEKKVEESPDALRKTIETLSQRISQQQPSPREEKGEEEETPPAPAPADQTVVQFVDEDGFNTALESVEGFNKVLNQVYTKGVEDTLLRVPNVVSASVQSHLTMSEAIKDFFVGNPDLAPYRQYVGLMANQLSSDNPDWTIPKLFGELETEVRKGLSVAKESAPAPTKKNEKEKSPAFPKKPKGPSGKRMDERSPLQVEIDKMIET